MAYTNSEIRDFLKLISVNNEYYASTSDKAMLRNYDECDDFVLSDELIKRVWYNLTTDFIELRPISLSKTPITMLHTNAGTGRILEHAPKNSMITAYNNDYVCKQISDLLNQANSVDFDYVSEIFDISHFFIGGYNGNTKKYDIVFTQPIENNYYYMGLDNSRLASYQPQEYYSCRSLDFLTKGGYLCVLTSRSNKTLITGSKYLNNLATLDAEIFVSPRGDEYGCLIFKKK
jgi:hypothetical protein